MLKLGSTETGRRLECADVLIARRCHWADQTKACAQHACRCWAARNHGNFALRGLIVIRCVEGAKIGTNGGLELGDVASLWLLGDRSPCMRGGCSEQYTLGRCGCQRCMRQAVPADVHLDHRHTSYCVDEPLPILSKRSGSINNSSSNE